MHAGRTTPSLIATVLVLSACGNAPSVDEADEPVSSEEAPSVNMVEVIALDYAFGIPEKIASGWVTFQMINRGKEPHVAFLYDLPDGVTWEDWVDANEQWEETGEDPE